MPMYMFVCFIFLLLMGDFCVASLNVNGARERGKRAAIFEMMRLKRVDVLLAQETHTDLLNAADWASEFDGLSILSHNTSTSGGVAILFSRSFTPISYEVEEIIKGRLLKVRALFESHFLVFLCIYAPTSTTERMLFLDSLNDTLVKCNAEDVLLLGGDFNCTELSCDRNHLEPHMPSRRRLIELINSNDLVDIWRNFHNGQRQYTWCHSYNNMLSQARLDRFYCFRHQLSFLKNCSIFPVGFSDHSLVTCFVFLNSIKPKSAYWHFNSNLLADKHFREVFTNFWTGFRNTKSSYKTLQKWWDCGKTQIKQLCQQYTAYVTKDLTRSIKCLEDDIIELQLFVGQNGDQDHIKNLKSKKKSLADLLGLAAQGALVRSRFLSVELMDAPSKFFFNLEKKNGQKRTIHALRSSDGHLLSNDADIRRIAVSFYKDLYRSEVSQVQSDNRAFLENLPQVSEGANAGLGQVLTLEELQEALQSMDCGKTPGLDGLSVDFYKSFWQEIGADVLAVLRDSLNRGRLPLSCRRAVLTLLPKKGDLTDIRCWRPISILCTDYKILSKVLANRLSKVLAEVIHPDQTYCVPGRLIHNNISFIRDVFDLGKLLELNFGLVSVDQEKAFDRVEHSYLWNNLAAFGFCQEFIKKIRVLYCDIESILKVNGGLCAPFEVKRGVRQGCALSGMLYALALEPLLAKLRQELHGVKIPCCEYVFNLSAFADDVAVFVNGQSDINRMLDIFNDFRVLSAAKVNWSKSEAMLVGKWSNGEPTLPAGLSWSRHGFKYLGVFLGNDSFILKNFEGVLEQLKGRLSKWKFLISKLSFKGRVLIINNLVASTLWHRLACVDPPARLLPQVQSILVDFFWDNLHWVPQSILFLPKEEGGHGLIHVQSRAAAFRLQFIQQLLKGPIDSPWKSVACAILQTFNGLGCDRTLFWMNPGKMNLCRLPVFYRNLFKVWSLFIIQRTRSSSLFWLLREPLICGSMLDLSVEKPFHAFSEIFMSSGVATLESLSRLAGPDLRNSVAVANHLGLRSIRVVDQLLGKWRTILADDLKKLNDYLMGTCSPDCNDFFPSLVLSPNLAACTDFKFKCDKLHFLGSEPAFGKSLYALCVKSFNIKTLDKRIDTPWRKVLMLEEGVRPQWRSLYKSPLTKKGGDLQWRILHGAIAVNAFISVLNPSVDEGCPFCTVKETVFHAFMDCVRLKPLFAFLQMLFQYLNELFSVETFILGFRYVQKNRVKCQLINFLLGQAKLAIYVSRRNKIEQNLDVNLVLFFSKLIRSRILIDFHFYKTMGDLEEFEQRWCLSNMLCEVVDDSLCFAPFLGDDRSHS